ncbi:Reverse transcriptase-like [Phytophthora infestans]|uniref:Reverse transcriptase-like n=1 Tax=Phytophthora infestans TaxID=4787 RepID=A0A833RP80_PHYIN|nr:Reverse transcriptase-like [Phytophthora infestans]
MTRGSPEHERLVRNVIDEGLIAAWARNQPPRQSPRTDRNYKPSNSRRSTRDRPTASAPPRGGQGIDSDVLSVPDALPLTNAVELNTTTTHVAETEGVYVVLTFVGGARVYQHRSAHASCVWSKSGELLWWTASTVHPSGTNNEMEALGLLTGLRWLHQHHRNIPIRILGDSAVVANMALAAYRECASNLQPMIRDIREFLSLLRRPLQLDHGYHTIPFCHSSEIRGSRGVATITNTVFGPDPKWVSSNNTPVSRGL